MSSAAKSAAERRRRSSRSRAGDPKQQAGGGAGPDRRDEALDETVEVLSDSGALSAIEAGLAELSREEIVTLEESRPQLTERRQARTAHDSSSSTATGGSSTP
jgi:hypothetical protein